MKYKTFETERLFIRPSIEEDSVFMLELMNTPKWKKFIGDRNLKTPEDAADYIRKRMLPQLERLGFSNYTVIRKKDGKKIGICGLYDREGLDGIDIGYGLLPEFEGKGYAYEASLKLLDAAFTEFQIKFLSAITAKANTSSQKLLEKLGLKLIGTIILPNETEEILHYQIQKEAFVNQPAN